MRDYKQETIDAFVAITEESCRKTIEQYIDRMFKLSANNLQLLYTTVKQQGCIAIVYWFDDIAQWVKQASLLPMSHYNALHFLHTRIGDKSNAYTIYPVEG